LVLWGGGADFFISLSCFNKRKKKIKIFRFSERNVVRSIRQEKKKGDKFTRGKNWAFPFERKMEPLGLQFIFFFFFVDDSLTMISSSLLTGCYYSRRK
jgi:hypothetical protein